MEMRKCAIDAQHRRFLLLSNGQSLIIGCSLNKLDHNEAAHLESSTSDEIFFNQEWTSGIPIP
jgi:hypothetical protein